MVIDNRVRLDPEYIKILRTKAAVEGYSKLTEYTKHIVEKEKRDLSLRLTGTIIPLGGFINKGKKNEKEFKFGF